MSTARRIKTSIDLDAPDPDEGKPPTGGWVRGVGNFARCDNRLCTSRPRGSLAMYRVVHHEGTARAYATQLCVACKLQEMAETFIALGMQPEPDPPAKGADVADPDWHDPTTRKAVDGVLLDKMQFEHLNRLVLRALNSAPAGVGVPDERGVELVSVAKRKGRERSKVKAIAPEELSGKRAEIGV